jgi:hypothetical protein
VQTRPAEFVVFQHSAQQREVGFEAVDAGSASAEAEAADRRLAVGPPTISLASSGS